MAKINKIKVENTEYDVEDTSALKEVPSNYKTKAENDELYQAKGDYATNQRANEIEAEIPDVSQFITKTVNDLTNYYLKSETYTKDENNNLLNAKQDTIDSSHKISSDLVDDTNSTNKFVTSSEKTTWNAKQNTLTAGDNITIENNVISASGGAQQVYVIEADYPSAWNTGSFTLDERDTETVNKFIEALLRGEKPLIILRSAVTSLKIQKFRNTMFGDYYYTSGATSVGITFYNLLGSSYTYYADTHYIRKRYLNIHNMTTPSTQTNFIVTAENYNDNMGFLTIKNTDAYTPTGDYNPATKKYVDDSIASAITDALGGNY